MKARQRLRRLTRLSTLKHRSRTDPGRWMAVAVGAAIAVAVGGYSGVVAGVVVAVIVGMVLWRREPAANRRARARDTADLPFCLDVFACCLRAGAPLDQAMAAAAQTVNQSFATRLQQAARCLRLGGTTAEALSEFDDVPAADRLTTAINRSADTGAMLADGLALLAQELRAESEHTALAGAHRAGVWMVMPLCLCFLPAFIVAGLVPVVMSSLTGILNTY